MAGAVNLVITKAPMNKNAISIGVDTGIGVELRRRFDSTFGQPLLDSTFGPALAEEGSNTGWAELYGFNWGEDNSEDEIPGDYVSLTSRRKKFPSID